MESNTLVKEDQPHIARSAQVKTHFSFAAITATAVILGLMATTASAQAPTGSSTANYGVRVIDVKRIFDNHIRFKKAMEDFRGEMQSAVAAQRQEQEAIKAMEEEAKTLAPGSDPRKAKEREIFRRRTDLAGEAKIREADLMEKEAKILYYTFKEIQDEVAYYCKVKNVAVVISYNSEAVDPKNAASIDRAIKTGVMGTVIAQNGVDITDMVLRVLNDRAGAPAAENESAMRPNPNVPRQ
jgi:Skp family chaperone for outer membrane proteins